MNTKTFICAQIARSHGNHQNRSIRSLPIKACRKTATGRYHHKLHPSSCSVVVCQLSLALALSFFASNASLSGACSQVRLFSHPSAPGRPNYIARLEAGAGHTTLSTAQLFGVGYLQAPKKVALPLGLPSYPPRNIGHLAK